MNFTQADYIKGLELQGRKTCLIKGEVWADYTEARTATRCPAFLLDPPEAEDVQKIFETLNPWIVTYATKAMNQNESNGFLYMSSNKEYDIEQLDRNGRRDARRALRCFDIGFSDWNTIAAKGFEAYHDTRSRNNISDATQAAFEKLIRQTALMACNKSIAAIDAATGEIGGFLILTEVDNWIEITGAFSSNRHLQNCPNNGLFHFSQEYYLKSNRADIISYGYSSIQTTSSVDGLHHFKERIGFQPVPVKRVFRLKPSLQFLLNPVSRTCIRILLNAFPSNRPLKKLEGILKFIEA